MSSFKDIRAPDLLTLNLSGNKINSIECLRGCYYPSLKHLNLSIMSYNKGGNEI